MYRCMTTNTVYEYDDANNSISTRPSAGTEQALTEHSSDSESDLEKDMLRAVFATGKRCRKAENLAGAE